MTCLTGDDLVSGGSSEEAGYIMMTALKCSLTYCMELAEGQVTI